MIKNKLLFFLFLFTAISLVAQENTLENQFDDVIKKSNSYQEFKVIKKVKINSLKKNVLDTVAQLEQNINSFSEEIQQQKTKITNLNNELETTQNNLSISKEKENSIEVFGVLTNKTTHNTIVFLLLGILLITIFILFYKFKNSHTVTKSTKDRLQETEEELESFRQRTLEREQQLRRKLQDEINKNKDSSKK